MKFFSIFNYFLPKKKLSIKKIPYYFYSLLLRASNILYIVLFVKFYSVKGRQRALEECLIKTYLPNQSFNTVIVMPIYNRPEYLNQTLNSLRETQLKEVLLILVDDRSNNTQILDQFKIDSPLIKIYKPKNVGMWDSLVIGFDYALQHFPFIEILTCLDSDTIHKSSWFQKLMELHQQFPHALVSGFNSNKHPTVREELNYVVKNSVGGINLCFRKEIYLRRYRSIILKFKIAWDWGIVFFNQINSIPMLVTHPSVIDHIGKTAGVNTYYGVDQAVDF